MVVDIGGMTSVSRLRRRCQPKGTLVIVGGESGSTWSPGMGRQLKAAADLTVVSQRLKSILNKEHYSGLERLAKLAATGDVTPRWNGRTPLPRSRTRSADSKRERSAARSSQSALTSTRTARFRRAD